jgi:hypothetical protein
MFDSKPKRLRWRTTLLASVAILLMIVAYPISAGPAEYFATRGWLPFPVSPVYSPAFRTLKETPAYDPWREYLWWWTCRANEHRPGFRMPPSIVPP